MITNVVLLIDKRDIMSKQFFGISFKKFGHGFSNNIKS